MVGLGYRRRQLEDEDRGRPKKMMEIEGMGNTEEIRANDIVFSCTNCGKSLAIEGRAVGMAISCPGCQNEIIVPPRVHLLDEEEPIELTPDERIRSLSNALQESHADIRNLSAHLSEVRKRRKYLEKLRADNISRLEQIAAEQSVLQSSIERVANILHESTSEDLLEM